MEKKLFLLETQDPSRIMRIIQIIFGILCIVVAIFWLIYNFKSLKTDKTLWITIVFLTGFGFYQVMAGLGKTSKYIETSAEKIVLKQHSFLPKIEIKPAEIEKIEFYPLSICFCLEKKKKFIFRFGITYPETIIPIKESITEFAEFNNIPFEIMKEEL
jgi:hypothetical protein